MSLVKSIGKQKVNLDFNKDFINLFENFNLAIFGPKGLITFIIIA